MENFDIVIIGSGPAGFSAAMRAIDFGQNVCIIEKKNIGGAGIINGALTSKTMWELSVDYAIAANINRGYRASGLVVDYEKVRKTVLNAAKEKQYQILSQIETFSKEKQKKGSISLKKGHAEFINKSSVKITDNEGKTEIVFGKNFIIATGSTPREYPNLPIDQERIINSDGILNLKKFPERMIIIGSGIIGCEFATIFSNFKQTEVHLLDRTNKVLPYEDDDVSDFVSKNLEANGVNIHYTATLREIRKKNDYLEIVLDYKDGHSKVIEADIALIAIGRVPNTQNLGLEKIGICKNQSGAINISELCSAEDIKNECNIFAAGDVTGKSQLFSVAELQGRYAVKSILKNNKNPLDYSNMSTLMFFKPEVAAVGMNEKMLRKNKIPYKSAWYSNSLVNRAIAMRSSAGFIKILISNDKEQKILGMRAAGPQASAFIVSIAHLINQENRLKEVMRTIHPHPSVTEGIQECLRLFENKSIYKPTAFPDLIKITEWKPE